MDEEQEEGTRSSSRRNKSAEDAQLVEHSADELEGLNRDVLNAEITQLEGTAIPDSPTSIRGQDG